MLGSHNHGLRSLRPDSSKSEGSASVRVSTLPHAVVLRLRVLEPTRVALSVGIHLAGSRPARARVVEEVDDGSSFARLAAWVRARLRRQSAAARQAHAWILGSLGDEAADVTRLREDETGLELEVELREPPRHEALLTLIGACLARVKVR